MPPLPVLALASHATLRGAELRSAAPMHAKTLCVVLPCASRDPVPPPGAEIALRFPSLWDPELFCVGHVWFCNL